MRHSGVHNGPNHEFASVEKGIQSFYLLKHFLQLSLANLKFLVLDEADKLVKDNIFFAQIQEMVQLACEAKGGHFHRTLMLSATLDETVKELADEIMKPGYFQVCVDSAQILPPNVRQHFVDVSMNNGKGKWGNVCFAHIRLPGTRTIRWICLWTF